MIQYTFVSSIVTNPLSVRNCVVVISIERTLLLKNFIIIYLKATPASTMSQFQLPRSVSHRRALERSLAHLRSCGCHHLWEEYTRTTIEGKACLIVCKRFESCINEQCWSEEDVNGSCLTENDKLLPFPETAKRALYTKLVAARSRKQSALQEVRRARRALE